MQAFRLALEAGAEMIELDVRRTGDGQLAILHDHDHAGVALDSCPLDEFEARTGFRPPLLSEVLDWATSRIALDVELKEDGYANQLIPLLEGFVAAGGELLVTSFADPLLGHLAQLAPSLRLGLLVEWTAARVAERAEKVGARTVLPSMKLVNERVMNEVTTAGMELIVWDFMAETDAALLADSRVAGVITDDVPGALAARAASSR